VDFGVLPELELLGISSSASSRRCVTKFLPLAPHAPNLRLVQIQMSSDVPCAAVLKRCRQILGSLPSAVELRIVDGDFHQRALTELETEQLVARDRKRATLWLRREHE
jgi:hypothetical protein